MRERRRGELGALKAWWRTRDAAEPEVSRIFFSSRLPEDRNPLDGLLDGAAIIIDPWGPLAARKRGSTWALSPLSDREAIGRDFWRSIKIVIGEEEEERAPQAESLFDPDTFSSV
jgi:hypothetical protein